MNYRMIILCALVSIIFHIPLAAQAQDATVDLCSDATAAGIVIDSVVMSSYVDHDVAGDVRREQIRLADAVSDSGVTELQTMARTLIERLGFAHNARVRISFTYDGTRMLYSVLIRIWTEDAPQSQPRFVLFTTGGHVSYPVGNTPALALLAAGGAEALTPERIINPSQS